MLPGILLWADGQSFITYLWNLVSFIRCLVFEKGMYHHHHHGKKGQRIENAFFEFFSFMKTMDDALGTTIVLGCTTTSPHTHTYTRSINSRSLIPSNATFPTKSSCSIATHGAILQAPKHGPSSTTILHIAAVDWEWDSEYKSEKVANESNPKFFRRREQLVDMQVTILNLEAARARAGEESRDSSLSVVEVVVVVVASTSGLCPLRLVVARDRLRLVVERIGGRNAATPPNLSFWIFHIPRRAIHWI